MVCGSYDLKIKEYGDAIRKVLDFNGYNGNDNFSLKAHDDKLIFIGWFDGDNKLVTQKVNIIVNRPPSGSIYRIAKYLNNDTKEIVLDIYHIFSFNSGYNRHMHGIIY